MATRTYDLILEITALRAKISRLCDEQMDQERIVKERVKREYDDLVHNLFSTSFALKNRFEEYRSKLYEDVVNGLFEVRTNALQRLKKISVGKDATANLESGIRHAENLRDVQSDKSALSVLVLKMKTMNDWKRTGIRSFYGKKVYHAKEEAELYKKALWETRLVVSWARTRPISTALTHCCSFCG